MAKLRHYHLYTVVSVICIGFLSWKLQNLLLLNGDVSWDLLATKRLMAGGTYTHDFFDLNPPLILWIYVPAVLLTKFFAIDINIALRCLVFGIALSSLFFCDYFIRRLFLKANAWLGLIFFVALALTFFILPGGELGEREHLVWMFTIPYFLTVACRLQDIPVSKWLAVIVGCFAFLGFALKPFYIIPFLFVEVYAMCTMRHLLSWWRLEAVSVVVLCILYAISVVVFYPDYLSTVLPAAMHFYYSGFGVRMGQMLNNQLLYFCVIAMVLYLFYSKSVAVRTSSPQSFSTLLFIVLMGFLLTYIMQQTPWFYHLFPAYATAILLITLLLSDMIYYQQLSLWSSILGITVVYSFPAGFMDIVYSEGFEYKRQQHDLIQFLQTYAQDQPVYFISATPREIFPAVEEGGAIYASRLLHLFWAPAIAKNAARVGIQRHNPQKTHYELVLNTMVVEDIERYKPKWIFVDNKQNKPYFSSLKFDYLSYLSKDDHFKVVWKSYRYVTSLKSALYQYNVYQRQDGINV